MEAVKLNNFIKNKLLRKPINIRSIKKSADNYQSVLDLFKKFKTDRKWFDYEICGIFDCFLNNNNHLIMYHSKDMETMLLMVKFENKYFNYELPYIEVNKKLENLKQSNFIAYYA